MKKKITTEIFIERALEIHGNKYNYSKTTYISYDLKVCIICSIHREFSQTPANHLKGQCCPNCAKNKKDDIISFTQRANKVYNYKYDYSKTEYNNCDTKVCIICPEHGEFHVTPYCHLKYGGCKECQNSERLKKQEKEFIKKATKIHENKYDYSKVKYKGVKTIISIICPIHGEFPQTPSKHLMGRGCHKCGGSKKLTQEEFLERSIKIHGNKYDYQKSNYVDTSTKVCIICPIHGEFHQTPNGHLQGMGCSKCGNIEIGLKSRLDETVFLKRCIEIHGDKFDYSKTKYISGNEKVCVICKTCNNEFWLTPQNHVSKHNKCGCPTCSPNRPSNTESFIEKATIVHNNKYNYSKVIYKKAINKVCIICSEHGEFQQTPHSHLSGKGCSSCSSSKLELGVKNRLNISNIEFVPQHKFDWLKHERKLEIDFYLPEYNIGLECHGEQHFIPVDFCSKGEEHTNLEFKKNQKRDDIKFNLCKEHGIRILYYTECPKSIIPETYLDTIYTNMDDLLLEIDKYKPKVIE